MNDSTPISKITVPVRAGFIRTQRCETCKYAAPAVDGQAEQECRFGPPTANGIFMGMGKNPVNGQTGPMIVAHTSFPRVKPNEWCGQWQTRVGA